MTKQEKKQAMAAELKKAGFNSRQVSIRSKSCTYSWSFDVKIHDINVPVRQVEDVVNGFENIRYDQYTGEILSGGNDYVFVEKDWNLQYPEPSKELVDIIDQVKAMEEGHGKMFEGYYVMNINGRIELSNDYECLDHVKHGIWHGEPTDRIARDFSKIIFENQLNEKYLQTKKEGMKKAS